MAEAQNTAMIFPKQLYLRFDGLGGDKGHTLQIGRFTFLDGSEVAPKNATLSALKRDRINQRLIGDFGWSDVGRSFDGVALLLRDAIGQFHLRRRRPDTRCVSNRRLGLEQNRLRIRILHARLKSRASTPPILACSRSNMTTSGTS